MTSDKTYNLLWHILSKKTCCKEGFKIFLCKILHRNSQHFSGQFVAVIKHAIEEKYAKNWFGMGTEMCQFGFCAKCVHCYVSWGEVEVEFLLAKCIINFI